jgi:hypothetical protein
LCKSLRIEGYKFRQQRIKNQYMSVFAEDNLGFRICKFEELQHRGLAFQANIKCFEERQKECW